MSTRVISEDRDPVAPKRVDGGAAVGNLQVAQGNAPAWYHPGRSAGLTLGPTVLAWFGEIHPAVLAAMDVKGPVAGFEVTVSAVPLPRAKASKTRPIKRKAFTMPTGGA